MNTRIIRFLFGATIALATALLLLILPVPVRAGGVVTNCTEQGLDAALAGGGTITFNCNGNNSPATIFFSAVYRTITQTTTIDGSNGGKTVWISTAGETNRIFSVTNSIALTLTNLNLANGFDYDGGCLYTNGALVLNNVLVINCMAATGTRGGAIYVNSGGSATLVNSSVLSSTAQVSGGGVYSLGALTVTSSYFSNNIATNNDGGGIWAIGNTRIDGSTFYSNTARNGGGVYNQGSVSMTQSTLSSNHSWQGGGGIQTDLGSTLLSGVIISGNTAASGGGIFNTSGATTTLTNVTVSGNSSAFTGGGIRNDGWAPLTNVTLSGNSSFNGGGIFNNSVAATTTLTNVTLSGNTAKGGGGGIFNANIAAATLTNVTFSGNSATGVSSVGGGIYWDSGTIALTNTIVANSPSGGNCNTTLGGSFNLSSDGTCGFGGGDNVNVMLAPLGNYGGSTQTHMLKPGSPAIDFGTNIGCPTTDQRGLTRPVNSVCDVGAVERQLVDFSYWLNLPLILR